MSIDVYKSIMRGLHEAIDNEKHSAQENNILGNKVFPNALYRGKDVKTNQWVYGYLSFVYVDPPRDKAAIYDPITVKSYDIYTDSVGQFVRVSDKYGKPIFTGDILRGTYSVWVVFSVKGGYAICQNYEWTQTKGTPLHYELLSDPQMTRFVEQSCEIVGNICDR